MTALILWLVVLVLSLLTIAAVVVRHVGEVAALDISTIPRAQEKNIKHGLAARRITRQLSWVVDQMSRHVTPVTQVWKKTQHGFRRLANYIADQYRHLEWKQKFEVWRGQSRHERRAHVLALLATADALRQAEDYAEAEKKYIELISLDPKNVSAYIGLGKTYFRRDLWKEAAEVFSHVIAELDAQHELALAFLARTRKAEGHMAEAAATFERALAVNSTLAKRWIDLGDCYRAMGGVAETMTAYKHAAECEPLNPWVLDHLLEIGVESGDKRYAREALAQLKMANPENQKLGEWESRIENM